MLKLLWPSVLFFFFVIPLVSIAIEVMKSRRLQEKAVQLLEEISRKK